MPASIPQAPRPSRRSPRSANALAAQPRWPAARRGAIPSGVQPRDPRQCPSRATPVTRLYAPRRLLVQNQVVFGLKSSRMSANSPATNV